jgi:hypothetical protein
MIKKLIAIIIIIMGLYYIYDEDLYGSKQFVRDIKKEVYLPSTNEYAKTNVNAKFVQTTKDFVPDNKKELLNIYYTAVNSGWDKFTFYCNYNECIDDVNNLSTDTILLSNINSYVSPYNQYSSISTYTTPLFNSKVTINISRTYSNQEIKLLNDKINDIYKSLDIEKLSIRDQILKIHDYIVNNTKYDSNKIDNINDTTYQSSTAIGALFEGYAVCSGYSDTMALFLDKLNVPNIKVNSDTHVWNLVYLDGKWYHLDLTWDDPYTNSDLNVINHNFFLIDYTRLKKWDTKEHKFDESVYIEAL